MFLYLPDFADAAFLLDRLGKTDFPVREEPGSVGAATSGSRTTAGVRTEAGRKSMASARFGSDAPIKKRRVKALGRVDVLIAQF